MKQNLMSMPIMELWWWRNYASAGNWRCFDERSLIRLEEAISSYSPPRLSRIWEVDTARSHATLDMDEPIFMSNASTCVMQGMHVNLSALELVKCAT